jgi:hypothetical protein
VIGMEWARDEEEIGGRERRNTKDSIRNIPICKFIQLACQQLF